MIKNILILSLSVLLLSSGCEKNPTVPKRIEPYSWTRSTPGAQNIDSLKLREAISHAYTWTGWYSLLVVRNGFLVSDTRTYLNFASGYNDHDIASVSKSFISALVGIALAEGLIDSLDQPIEPFFPEYFPSGTDARKKQITVRHLLTMTGGLESTEDDPIPWPEDWLGYIIGKPVLYTPGQIFDYSTGYTHLLSALLTRVSSRSTFQYANEKLFNPLEIHCTEWSQDPQGYYIGGAAMYFYPEDLARFGELMLNNGSVDGQQIIPVSWIQESTQTHISNVRSDSSGYGFLWWTKKVWNLETFYAEGYGGNFIYVVPDLQLIVVLTGDYTMSDQQFQTISRAFRDFIPNYIFSAILDFPN